MDQPNCFACEFFHTTHDPRAPRGCHRFGFKTRNMPSLEVLTSTGKRCIFFEEKASQPSFAYGGGLRDGSTICLVG